MQPQKQEKILRLAEVINRTGLSRSSIYSYIKKKLFPSPVKIGERSVGWPESRIDDWVQSRINS